MIKYLLILILFFTTPLWAQSDSDIDASDVASGAIFDDKVLLDGYLEKYQEEPQEILLAMIADESLGSYKCAAAVKVFSKVYAPGLLTKEKSPIIKTLIRRMNQTESPFVQVEIMHALVVLDRYQYFESMVPALIQKMEHYNKVVSIQAYHSVQAIIKGSTRNREARIVFNTLRKVLFLTRNKLQNIQMPDTRLRQKLDLVRWSVKVLGTQELKRLPSEVISLL